MLQENYYLMDFEFGNLPCRISAITPDYVPELAEKSNIHAHPSFELHAILHGESSFRVGKQEYTLSDGQCILIAPRIYHCVLNPSEGLRKMVISFDVPRPDTVQKKEAQAFASALYTHNAIVFSDRETLNVLLSIKALVEKGPVSFWQSERMKAAMALLLLDIYEELGGDMDTSQLPRQINSQSAFLIDEFFNLNYARNDGREILAEQLHISSRQLDRIIQKHYGMSFREKLLDIRLTNALDFLLTTDMSIAEISERVGYASQTNFSAFIKRATGQSPTEIRRINGKNH